MSSGKDFLNWTLAINQWDVTKQNFCTANYMSEEVDYRMKKKSLPDVHLTQGEYLEYEKKISTSRKQTT